MKVDEVSLHNLDIKYSKTCLKRPLKYRQNKDLMTNCILLKAPGSILQYF